MKHSLPPGADRILDPREDFAYLGTKEQVFGGLDTFPNPGVGLVRMTSDEVTSLCPITGQPDYEVVDVTYAPRERCIESKAWKMYLASLRNTAGFVEALSIEIANMVVGAIEPEWVRVDVTQKPRGGVSIVAVTILDRLASGYYPRSFDEAGHPLNYYMGH